MAYDLSRDPYARGLGTRFGQTFGALYAPPSMGEVAGVQRVRQAQAEEAALEGAIQQIASVYGPGAAALVRARAGGEFGQFERIRQTQGRPDAVDYTYGNYTQSPGGQLVAEGAETGRTRIQQAGETERNRADNQRQVATAAIAPISQGAIRPGAPTVASLYALPELAQPFQGNRSVSPGEINVPGGPVGAPAAPAAASPYDPGQHGPRVSRLNTDGTIQQPAAAPPPAAQGGGLPPGTITGTPTEPQLRQANLDQAIAAMTAGGMHPAIAAAVRAGVPLEQAMRAHLAAGAMANPGTDPATMDPVVYALGGNAGNTFTGTREAQAGQTQRTGLEQAGQTQRVGMEQQGALERALVAPIPENAVQQIPPTAAARVNYDPQGQTVRGNISAGQGETVRPAPDVSGTQPAPVQGREPMDTRPVRNFQVLDAAGQVVGVFPSRDGVTRTDGTPLAGQGQSVGMAMDVLANNPRDAMGATNTNITNANALAAELTAGAELIKQVEGLLQMPGLFGIPGRVRGLAQDVQQTVLETLQAFGAQNPDVAAYGQRAATELGQWTGGEYNSNIPKAQKLLYELAYLNARLNDPSGEVSRAEFERNVQTLGVGGWFTNSARVQAMLDATKESMAARSAAVGALRNPRTVAPPAGGAGGAGGAGAPTGPQEGATATNPSTGQRLRFQGGQWVPLQ